MGPYRNGSYEDWGWAQRPSLRLQLIDYVSWAERLMGPYRNGNMKTVVAQRHSLHRLHLLDYVSWAIRYLGHIETNYAGRGWPNTTACNEPKRCLEHIDKRARLIRSANDGDVTFGHQQYQQKEVGELIGEERRGQGLGLAERASKGSLAWTYRSSKRISSDPEKDQR